MTEYYKHICKAENAQQRPKFLSAMHEWVRQHNEKPGKISLKSKKELIEVHTVIDTEEVTGGRFEKPEMEFVLIENWDHEAYGPPDMSKVTEEVIFGKLCKGIFREVGKKGHYRFKEYDDKSVKIRAREHDGEGPFAEEALAAKRKAALELQGETSKARHNVAVVAKPAASLSDVMQLLRNTGALAVGPHGGTVADQHDTSNAQAQEVEGDCSDSDPEPEGGGSFARLQSHVKGRRVAKASAPAGAVATAPAKTVAKGKAKSASGRGFIGVPGTCSAVLGGSSPSGKAGPSAPVVDREVVVLDGRAKRLKSSLSKSLETSREDFVRVKFDEKQEGPHMSKAEKEELSKAINEKFKQLSKIENSLRTQQSRITKSPNQVAFETELQQIELVLAQVRSCSRFLGLMKQSSPPADEWEQAMDEVTRYNISLSPPYLLQDLAVKTQRSLMYKDYAGLCKPYRRGSAEVAAQRRNCRE